MNAIYKTKVTTSGGRNGHIKSEDGIIDLEVRIPKEMGGQGGAYSNPEQLFAAGYSSCFDSALNYVALLDKVKLQNTSVTAVVGINNHPEKGFSIEVELDVYIPGIEKELALTLLDKAHKACPYSKAISGNVDVKLNLIQD